MNRGLESFLSEICKTVYMGILDIVGLFRGHSYKFSCLKIAFGQMKLLDYSLMRREMLIYHFCSLVTDRNKARLVGGLKSGSGIVGKQEKGILLKTFIREYKRNVFQGRLYEITSV